jgi:epoxide hydrolase 4
MKTVMNINSLICWSLLLWGLPAYVLSTVSLSDYFPTGFKGEHSFVHVGNNIVLHCVESGKSNGNNTILLLHGFPEFWYTWKRQIPFLVENGYHVVVPDLRGFGLSSKPSGVQNYGAMNVSEDVESLRQHYCGNDGKFSMIVGHDWGAVVTWTVLQRFPNIAYRAAILNVPHPSTAIANFFSGAQILKSWYIYFFQIPIFPELLLGSSWARNSLTDELEASAGFISEEDRLFYHRVVSINGAVRGGLSYYRAAGCGLWPNYLSSSSFPFVTSLIRYIHGVEAPSLDTLLMNRIDVPVLVLWGKLDKYLGMNLSLPPISQIPNLTGPIYLDTSHWPHIGSPDIVNDHILQFVQSDHTTCTSSTSG